MRRTLFALLFLTAFSPHAFAMQSITADYARELAEASIRATTRDGVITRTEEHDFGWVFRYDSKRHIQTHDPNHMIPGTAPLIVTRTGETVQLPSSIAPEQAIEIFATDYKTKQKR